MVHVRSYTRTVSGHAVEVASHERAAPPSTASATESHKVPSAGTSQTTSYTKLKAAGRSAEFNYVETLPEKRWSDITNRSESYAKAVTAIDQAALSETEKHLYKLFYVWEGGMNENSQGTEAGITPSTLFWASDGVPGLTRTSRPRDMTEEQLPQVYRNVLDEGLKWAGGASALSRIPDVDVAAFVGDTILREGGPKAARDIQYALNKALLVLEQPAFPLDFKVGLGTIEKIAEVTSS